MGLFCFVTYYHKGYAIKGSTKIIHRYLPPEIGELLVYFQWLILPFQRVIALRVFERTTTEYLFQKSSGKSYRPKTLTSDQFRVVFRRETLIGLGVAINPSIYRHIAIAISRRFLGKQHQFQQDEEGYSDPENDSDYKDDIIDL